MVLREGDVTRRQLVAALTVLLAPMASWRGVSAAGKPLKPAWLTVDLNQWDGITFKHGKETIHFTAEDVFEALKEQNH